MQTKKEIMKELGKLQDALRLKDEEFIARCKITKKDAIIFNKKRHEISEDEKIPITSDAMFKTMMFNKNRKEYSEKLISYIFGRKPEYFELTKNEHDRDIVDAKGEIGDFVAKFDDTSISIEMNLQNTLEKAHEYANRLYNEKVRVGSDYKYSKTLQIIINNFSPVGKDCCIQVFYIMTVKEELMIPMFFVDIYIPNIRKKMYNKEELTELEKYILVLCEPDKKKALTLAGGDMVMEKFVDESKYVERNDLYLYQAYDHEQALIDSTYEDACEKKQLEIIKKMQELGKTTNDIAECLSLTEEQVLECLETLKENTEEEAIKN